MRNQLGLRRRGSAKKIDEYFAGASPAENSAPQLVGHRQGRQGFREGAHEFAVTPEDPACVTPTAKRDGSRKRPFKIQDTPEQP